MKFPLANFLEFCRDFYIESKERGLISLGDNLLGTQKYFFDEVAKALDEDIHYFVVLKGRQEGISTAMLALDAFWHFKHAGMQGTLATDNEQNRDMFRSTLSVCMEHLSPKWRIPIVTHNRNQLVLKNRSRMIYQVAGTRRGKGGGMGRGKAIIFMHATEVSSWVDQEGLASLEASLAERNPNRLYVFESTARGFNMFWDMWDTALIAKTQRAIFVGWWRNELYRVEKDSPIYKVYWDGHLSAYERQCAKEVKQLYGFVVEPEQFAWYRWKMAEVIKDETLMRQEFPWTAEEAFILSGSQFFASGTINDRYKVAKGRPFDSYRIVMGENFRDTELVDARPDRATLKIWHMPVPGAYYVIGADPAYGSSDWADRFAGIVYRVWADGMEEVAEFCTAECNTFQFAWVIAYLAGAYGPNVLYNLEINGPGQAVYEEMKNLKRMAAVEANNGEFERGLYNVLACTQSFVYRRIDSVMGSAIGWHFKSNQDLKERMLNFMRDCFERGILVINSVECLEEMKNVIREDGVIGAPGRGKDDRVIATALAALAWNDQIRMKLAQGGITKEKSLSMEASGAKESAVSRNVENYLKSVGITPA